MDMLNASGGLVGRWTDDSTLEVAFVRGTYLVRVHGSGEGFSVIDVDLIPKGVTEYKPDPHFDIRNVPALRLLRGGWVVPT
ncbi:MAG: hypothetical protein Q8L37_00220 [Candidatus Gottesmanbacteria bacterium]|nr:hypothetical protein [Candidatus Gottesmanbacteria bacterium]